MLLPGATMVVALERAEAVRAELAGTLIDPGDGTEIRSTVSVGVAVFRGEGDSHEAALRRADAALYEAKRAGRNRVIAVATEARG